MTALFSWQLSCQFAILINQNGLAEPVPVLRNQIVNVFDEEDWGAAAMPDTLAKSAKAMALNTTWAAMCQ
jgi:hypothetical protein